jgi:hypothetical protein
MTYVLVVNEEFVLGYLETSITVVSELDTADTDAGIEDNEVALGVEVQRPGLLESVGDELALPARGEGGTLVAGDDDVFAFGEGAGGEEGRGEGGLFEHHCVVCKWGDNVRVGE